MGALLAPYSEVNIEYVSQIVKHDAMMTMMFLGFDASFSFREELGIPLQYYDVGRLWISVPTQVDSTPFCREIACTEPCGRSQQY